MDPQIPFTIRTNSGLISLEKPIVMAIINITPDSFYTSCKSMMQHEILFTAEKAIDEGACILDIGGYSTRPGAPDVSTEEETKRICNALKWIRKEFPSIPISVDTFRSKVAEIAIENGADMINDISGGTLDEAMFSTIAQLKVPYILMHMRGTPATMQSMTKYDNLLSEIIHFFEERIRTLALSGVNDIILDPGFGFAKTLDQNYELLQKLPYLQQLGYPLLAGISHKSMLYKLLDVDAAHTLNATTVANTIALMNGANILRVHDVKEAVEAIKIVEKTKAQ